MEGGEWTPTCPSRHRGRWGLLVIVRLRRSLDADLCCLARTVTQGAHWRSASEASEVVQAWSRGGKTESTRVAAVVG